MSLILMMILLACSNKFKYDMELNFAEIDSYQLINDLLDCKKIDREIITSFKNTRNMKLYDSADIKRDYYTHSLINKIEKEEKRNIHYLNTYWHNSDNEIKLFLSYFYGYRDEIKLLLENHIYYEYINKYGNNSLIEALKRDCLESIIILLKNRDKIDLENKYTSAILMKVIISFERVQEFQKIFNLLIDSGADINYKNSIGETALSIMIEASNKNAIKFLLKRGAVIEKDSNVFNLFNLVIAEKNREEQKDLLNLILIKDKRLNIDLFLLMYEQSLNYGPFRPSFEENLFKNINIYNLFALDTFTFKHRTLLIDTFLNVIEIYDLTFIDEVKSIKIEIIELFIKYYGKKLNSTDDITEYENEFITLNYNLKYKVSEFISKIFQATNSFDTSFTTEELIQRMRLI